MDVNVNELITTATIGLREAETREFEGTKDAQEKSDLCNQTVRALKLHLEYLNSVDEELSDRIISLGVRHLQHGLHDRLREAQKFLRSGDAAQGVPMDEVQFLVGRPNFEATQHYINLFRARRKALRAHITKWPTSDSTRKFRYIGKLGKHILADGTALRPGEVVELTATQATAWASRFEEVEDEVEVSR